MTKAELWLKRSLDTDGRLGGRGLYLLQQCPPVGEKKWAFHDFCLIYHWIIALCRSYQQVKPARVWAVLLTRKGFCKNCIHLWNCMESAYLKKIWSISDISDTWLDEWNAEESFLYPTISIATLNLMQTRLLQLHYHSFRLGVLVSQN